MSRPRTDAGRHRFLDSARRRGGRSATDQAVASSAPHFTRYVIDGVDAAAPAGATVADALTFAEASTERMAMFFYPAPTDDEIEHLAEAWELHPLLVEDLVHAGQRPKLERYGGVLFLVVRSARYIDESEEVEFSEFHILVRDRAVAVLCQDHRWIDGTDGTAVTGERATTPDRRERTLLADQKLCASALKRSCTGCSTPSSTRTTRCCGASASTASRSSARCSAATRRRRPASTTSAERRSICSTPPRR